MYSIIPKLHVYKNNSGNQSIVLQVIVDRIKVTRKTKFHVKESQFKNGKVIKHELAEKYNYHISKERLEIENKLLNAFKHQSKFTKQELDFIVKGKSVATGESFTDFADTVKTNLKGKLSDGRLTHYNTVINKIIEFNPNTKVGEINSNWLVRFENHLRKTNISNATILSNIKIVKRIIRIAKKSGIVSTYDFTDYENPKPVFKEAEFLTEKELKDFSDVCKDLENPIIKIPGYYFLLSCYSGLRISDALSFNHKTQIINDELVLIAQKNKKRSGIDLFPELIEVIEFIKQNFCRYHQKTVRDSVKKIALMAGIKKNVKYHCSRHTFCTRMLRLGFDIADVADMSGDSIQTIIKTYLHTDREARRKKVKELLG